MATVSNWIDHLNKPAEEVGGSVYPGAGSSEFILVLVLIAVWIGWTVITSKSESDELNALSRKRHSANCLLYTSPSPRDGLLSRMPSSA